MKVAKGWNQLRKEELNEPLTLEKIEQMLKEIFKEKISSDKESFPPVGFYQGGLYHLGKGVWTGYEGWVNFNKLLSEEAVNFIKKDTGLSPVGSIFNSKCCVPYDSDATFEELKNTLQSYSKHTNP